MNRNWVHGKGRKILSSLVIFYLLVVPGSLAVEKNSKTLSAALKLSKYEAVGHQAVSKIGPHYLDLLADWKLQFHHGRPGLLGLTSTQTRSIDIWIRREQSVDNVAKTISHELAHAFDLTYLTPQMRKHWLVARNLPANTPWYPCNMCEDRGTGSGDFAECFGWTLMNLNSKANFHSKLGPPPNQKQRELILKWLSEVKTASR